MSREFSEGSGWHYRQSRQTTLGSVGEASGPKTPAGVKAVVWGENSFFSRKPQFFALRPSSRAQSPQTEVVGHVCKHPHSNARIGVWARNWRLEPS